MSRLEANLTEHEHIYIFFFADVQGSDVTSRDYKNVIVSLKEGALEKEKVNSILSLLYVHGICTWYIAPLHFSLCYNFAQS